MGLINVSLFSSSRRLGTGGCLRKGTEERRLYKIRGGILFREKGRFFVLESIQEEVVRRGGEGVMREER